jgi:hypothetical protein
MAKITQTGHKQMKRMSVARFTNRELEINPRIYRVGQNIRLVSFVWALSGIHSKSSLCSWQSVKKGCTGHLPCHCL